MAMPPVAVIADAHVHDITGDYGVPGFPVGNRRLTLRSWADTATGARAFNESGAALDAALAEVRARGIRHVVLLGDYTDDGQAETTARLSAYLVRQRDLSFYAIPGNHDVWATEGKHTATRFATGPLSSVLVTSDPTIAEAEADSVLTAAVRCHGQPAALRPMAAFGMFRQPGYLHWESPFGMDDAPEARSYTARAADGSVAHRLMDASYLVEPVPGLWLLVIDANVFEPRPGIVNPRRKRAFLDPSTAGWNAVLHQKPFLLDWIADVSRRAGRAGKALVALSHYPALDPFEDDGSERLLFGQSDVARRTPGAQVGGALVAAGIRLHLGGHLHADAVTVRGGLTNHAVPSLAAFPPAFKVLHPGNGFLRVETVSLAGMAPDPDLIGFYRGAGIPSPMLDAPDHGTFLWHQSRARALHRLPRDWPVAVARALAGATLADVAACIAAGDAVLAPGRPAAPGIPADIPATDLAVDWHALRQGGALARGRLSPARIAVYRHLIRTCADPSAMPDSHAGYLARFLAVFARALDRAEGA